MEGKKSKGVTIVAWLMIIVNIYALLVSFQFRANFFDVYRSFSKSFNIALILYSILLSAIGIIAGFGILKLKNIMRKVAVTINSIDLLFGVPLFFLALNDLRQYAYATAVYELTKKPINLTLETMVNLCFYTAVFTILASFAWNLLFIFFFTRPKVKEQFK